MSSSSSGPPSPHEPPSWLPDVIRRDPLWSHSNFMRLWYGRAVPQFGTQISLVAIPLYAVLALDANPLEMGMLAAAAGAPRLLLGFVAGAWVDRLRRKPIMVATDLGRALAVAAIPITALLGVESFALLVAVEIVLGLLTIFF